MSHKFTLCFPFFTVGVLTTRYSRPKRPLGCLTCLISVARRDIRELVKGTLSESSSEMTMYRIVYAMTADCVACFISNLPDTFSRLLAMVRYAKLQHILHYGHVMACWALVGASAGGSIYIRERGGELENVLSTDSEGIIPLNSIYNIAKMPNWNVFSKHSLIVISSFLDWFFHHSSTWHFRQLLSIRSLLLSCR